MKFITLLALACTAVLSGCKKNDYTEANAMKFSINGVSDVTMKYTDSATLPLTLKFTGGKQAERLTLYIDGLPAGVNASYTPQAGIPDFASQLKLRSVNAAGGKYNVKVIGTPASGKSTSYDMILTIIDKAETGCADDVAGTYTALHKGDYIGTISTQVETESKNKMLFRNTLVGYFIGDLDCDGKKVTVKHQFLSGNKYISGSGTFTASAIELKMYSEDIFENKLGEFTISMWR